MLFYGRAWKFGSDIDTDAIIPARYLTHSDPVFLAKYCMENENPLFVSNMKPGDIIVAGSNFGCGSSREHAPIAIQAKGVSCVIAESFARIFYRNAFNMGLPILECREAAEGIEDGHEIEVDLKKGVIRNKTAGSVFQASSVPEFMQKILEDGGLIGHIIKRRKG